MKKSGIPALTEWGKNKEEGVRGAAEEAVVREGREAIVIKN
jgi:hypothetical protein